MKKKEILIGLAGNPNCGKTTIFNLITGMNHKVGNYPGVTVERIEGAIKYKDISIRFVDLPGIYSLDAFSDDEKVARYFILNEKPDLILNVLDSSNLERNLYLTTQLIEMNLPILLVLNMSDVAKGKGIEFDKTLLSKGFSARVVSAIGHKGNGKMQILEAIYESLKAPYSSSPKIHYGNDIEREIKTIADSLAETRKIEKLNYLNWISLKLLENDNEILKSVESNDLVKQVEKSREKIENLYHDVPEVIIADRRYGFISGVCHNAVKNTVDLRHSFSDKIDEIVTSKVLGLPFFLLMMYLVFYMTFTLGEFPMQLIESFFGLIKELIIKFWPSSQGYSFFKSLMVDGIIGGVGGVIVFLPNIILLFLGIALLEDTGYMARAAYVLDKWMQKIGLHGKSFIPMLIGFGCTVPAIMSTRILENKREKLMTILVLPLMSCGARFPIYALIIPAFFPKPFQGPVLWGIYMFGIILAVLILKFSSKTVLKNHESELIMELPPYRVPTFKALFFHMWFRTWLYLKKAGTVILGFSILLWALTTLPAKKEHFEEEQKSLSSFQVENSYAGRLGKIIEPVIKPLGFDWKVGTALIGAMGAKEVFVSQMGIIFSIDDAESDSDSLRKKLKDNYSPLQALCIMIFCLVSAPCMATITMTKKESGKWKWALLQFFGLTFLAYSLCLIVYQTGTLIGF